ncbi:hypothetical protein [Peribacillus simplex]|uniref:hypothetical protein n=1 Tax=Peribacillus simplex TaxID=1478 RepID=UPI003D268356
MEKPGIYKLGDKQTAEQVKRVQMQNKKSQEKYYESIQREGALPAKHKLKLKVIRSKLCEDEFLQSFSSFFFFCAPKTI